MWPQYLNHDNIINSLSYKAFTEFTGGLPLTNAIGAELWCFVWSAPEQTVEQAIGTLVIWDAMALIMT